MYMEQELPIALIFGKFSRILTSCKRRMIAENLITVRKRIEEACLRCDRRPDEVLLVAVSKTFSSDVIRDAAALGQLDFGENYVQEWLEKREQLTDLQLRWHFIGHLQTNKAKFAAAHARLIHAVDDLRLVEELQKRAERLENTVDILIEVHTTDEATKFGVAPGETRELVRQASRFDRVRIRGLMTMGPFSDDAEASRSSFRIVRELRDRIREADIPGVSMDLCSMGMTHDMEIAIEEGATIVRIGTAIFGQRKKRTDQ
jgi:hypothetical protein